MLLVSVYCISLPPPSLPFSLCRHRPEIRRIISIATAAFVDFPERPAIQRCIVMQIIFQIDRDIMVAVYDISAKIFYATYAILIISPFRYRLQPCALTPALCVCWASPTCCKRKLYLFGPNCLSRSHLERAIVIVVVVHISQNVFRQVSGLFHSFPHYTAQQLFAQLFGF